MLIRLGSARARMGMVLAIAAAGCAAQPDKPSPAADPKLARAEALIDAFYSFQPTRLRSAMVDAAASLPVILYYQGWAEGGNYIVRDRKPCRVEGADEVICAITVQDDLIAALGTGDHVTDTFHLSFRDDRLVGVRTSSNDPPQFDEALKWLRAERPELFSGGACRGFFAGGPTPQDCVRAVVRGFAEFGARNGS